MAQNDLTVILTLWDRVEFTYRWMRWMDQQRFPYKILIADGGSDRDIELHLKNSSHYPNLDYEYLRYPYDSSVEVYFKKLADVSSKVKSSYAILADNDDFILLGPLEKNLEIIRKRSDVHTVGPEQYRFAIRKKAKNKADLVSAERSSVVYRRQISRANKAKLLSDEPMERLLEIVKRFYSSNIYYGIHPAGRLHTIFKRFSKLQIRQLIFNEWHLLYSLGVGGKVMLTTSDPFLARQDDTSQSAASTYETDNHETVFLLRDWSSQFYAMMDDIYGQLLEVGHKVNREKYENEFRRAFKIYMLGWLQFRGVAERFKRFPRLYVAGRILYRLYAGAGARRIRRAELRGNAELSALNRFLEEYKGLASLPNKA